MHLIKCRVCKYKKKVHPVNKHMELKREEKDKSCMYEGLQLATFREPISRVAACLSFKGSPGAQPFKWK